MRKVLIVICCLFVLGITVALYARDIREARARTEAKRAAKLAAARELEQRFKDANIPGPQLSDEEIQKIRREMQARKINRQGGPPSWVYEQRDALQKQEAKK